MKLLWVLLVSMSILVALPALVSGHLCYGKAKKYGLFRKEYERSMIWSVLGFSVFILGGLTVWGLVEEFGRSNSYHSASRQAFDALFAIGLIFVLGLIAAGFGWSAVVSARRSFPKQSRFVFSIAILLGAILGPVGLGIVSLMGLGSEQDVGEKDTTSKGTVSSLASLLSGKRG